MLWVFFVVLIKNICAVIKSILALMALLRQPNSYPKIKLPIGMLVRCQPKPKWVRNEVIRLKAFMPSSGCRGIALTFNRLYADKKQMTVGKSFVYETIKKHRYEIQVLRRNIKHKKPRPLPKNLIWAMDLTQVKDQKKQHHLVFGMLDCGTRANLCLRAIQSKASIVLLRTLLDVIERYGQPKIIRTDNEAVFVSRLFRFALWLLGIKHQRTEKCCPWQNGKIERFFGTLKNKLNNFSIQSVAHLQDDLLIFRCWYNHIRPHQNLNGRTPAEAWSKARPNKAGKHFYFLAWENALNGFYVPPD